MYVDQRFIDREAEVAELHRLADRAVPTIALIYGRRRVGKTYLLEHAFADRRVFYFVAAEITAELNRAELLRELGRWSQQEIDPQEYPTWRTVFRLLADQADAGPLVAILDEFQYLMGGTDAIASQLVAIFDREMRGRPLLLVLSGSSVSMMEQLLHGSQPLFG
jgi:AAA+ ATPase superfamily predicted ATPase